MMFDVILTRVSPYSLLIQIVRIEQKQQHIYLHVCMMISYATTTVSIRIVCILE